jgi:phosphoesterase RecJ-like protein
LVYESGDGKIKGSLRTEKNNVNLTLLASYLGGGGHKKASGFSVNGKLICEGGKWKIV